MSGKLRPIVLCAALAVALPALAGPQAPAELPPRDFTAKQYVDSRGCVFLRASYQGREEWVPRLSSEGKQLCGYAPSLPNLTQAQAPSEPVAATGEKATAAAASDGKMQQEATSKPKAGRAEPQPKSKAAKAKPQTTKGKKNFAVKLPDERPRTPITGEIVTIDGSSFRLTCPLEASVAKSFALHGGGHTLLCTKGDGSLDGASAPRLASKVGPAQTRAVAPPPQGKGAFYVQVGAFGVEKNARATVQRLAGLGLPVVKRAGKGKSLQLIFAGPFASVQEAHSALSQVRGLGFSDAVVIR